MASRNNDGKIVIVLIVLLVSFALGSGIGIAVGMSGNDLNSTINQKPINTTIDVTHNMSQDNPNYNMSINAYEENYENLNSSDSSSSAIYYSEDDLGNKYNNYT